MKISLARKEISTVKKLINRSLDQGKQWHIFTYCRIKNIENNIKNLNSLYEKMVINTIVIVLISVVQITILFFILNNKLIK